MKNNSIKKRSNKFLENNAVSEIFKDIYNKNIQRDKENNLYTNKTEELLKIIENMRLKEEMIETEKDYIMKESRKEVKINQELINLFGVRKRDYRRTKKFEKIKLDKKMILNPLEKKEFNLLLTKYKNKKHILKLPIINIKKNNSMKTIIKGAEVLREEKILHGSEENIQKLILSESSSISNFDESKKVNDSISTYYSHRNNDKNKNILKRNKHLLLTRHFQLDKKITSRTLKAHKSISDVDILKDFALNKANKKPLINLLNDIKEELQIDEIKHKKYFRNNGYGCEISKYKIDYLEKYYFKSK